MSIRLHIFVTLFLLNFMRPSCYHDPRVHLPSRFCVKFRPLSKRYSSPTSPGKLSPLVYSFLHLRTYPCHTRPTTSSPVRVVCTFFPRIFWRGVTDGIWHQTLYTIIFSSFNTFVLYPKLIYEVRRVNRIWI